MILAVLQTEAARLRRLITATPDGPERWRYENRLRTLEHQIAAAVRKTNGGMT